MTRSSPTTTWPPGTSSSATTSGHSSTGTPPAPGTRLWDLAYAFHGFAPLSANPAYHRNDASRRLRLIADAYGLTEQERLDIIPLLAHRTQTMHAFLAEQAAQGTQPWARLWQAGHGDAWQADTSYITQREVVWRQALLG